MRRGPGPTHARRSGARVDDGRLRGVHARDGVVPQAARSARKATNIFLCQLLKANRGLGESASGVCSAPHSDAGVRVPARRAQRGGMPAPPFLLGLTTGVSLTAIAKAASELSSGDEGQARGTSSAEKRRVLIVRPKPFVRVPAAFVPADPCPDCDGRGKCMCERCLGRGRTNFPDQAMLCLLYTSPSPRDLSTSRMPSSA